MTYYYNGFPQSEHDEKLNLINVDQLEEDAKRVIPEGAYYHIASGAENEWTWRNNTAAFNHYQIVPRALTDMEDPQLDTKFMGMKLKTPVMIAPIACHGIAHEALGAGADGIYVTNHGGREIDGSPATIDVLPDIAKAVNHRVPIIFDSGVRRGSHVFKALALGADLVAIGRPYLYGLALGGAKGVESVIEQYNKELKIDMQLTGCKTIDDVKKAKIMHINYTADNLPSNTDPSRMKPYPVTSENQPKEDLDATSGASHH